MNYMFPCTGLLDNFQTQARPPLCSFVLFPFRFFVLSCESKTDVADVGFHSPPCVIPLSQSNLCRHSDALCLNV